jgi:hypothetical protein
MVGIGLFKTDPAIRYRLPVFGSIGGFESALKEDRNV